MKTNVWIIGGFLGAGKTTLLMGLARTLAASRPKGLAIIANDFSQVGVDQRVLREVCPSVYELFDGCVCCQLSIDLIQTIERVRSGIAPALILIEPSGIAEPARIVDTLRKYSKGLGLLRTLVVVDATRFEELLDTLEPLMTAQVTTGDVLAINKVDAATPEDIADVRRAIAGLNPGASILEVSALAPGDIARIAAEMNAFEGPTAHAADITLSGQHACGAEEWQDTVADLVSEIAAESARRGATVVGHIKVFASGAGGLRIYCSSTGPERPPVTRRIDEQSGTDDGIAGSGHTLTVNLNAIVYGLSARELADVVDHAVSSTKSKRGIGAGISQVVNEHHHSEHSDGTATQKQ